MDARLFVINILVDEVLYVARSTLAFHCPARRSAAGRRLFRAGLCAEHQHPACDSALQCLCCGTVYCAGQCDSRRSGTPLCFSWRGARWPGVFLPGRCLSDSPISGAAGTAGSGRERHFLVWKYCTPAAFGGVLAAWSAPAALYLYEIG